MFAIGGKELGGTRHEYYETTYSYSSILNYPKVVIACGHVQLITIMN